MLHLLSQMSNDEPGGTYAAVSGRAVSRGKPELSVVLVCDRVDTIARTLWHLRHQTPSGVSATTLPGSSSSMSRRAGSESQCSGVADAASDPAMLRRGGFA